MISMSNPLTSGTTMAAITALRDKYGYGFYEALGKQNVGIESGVLGLQRLENGERSVIMVLEESVLRRRQEERANLEIIYPSDGTIVITSPIMIVASAWSANNNTKSAEIIADWFLGQDGQNAIVDGWMHSVRRDITRTPFGSIPMREILANSMPFNWEHILNDRKEIISRFEELALARR